MTIFRINSRAGKILLLRRSRSRSLIGMHRRAKISSARAASAGTGSTRNRRRSSGTDAGRWPAADAMLRGKWWEIFNDPELNALEEQLNINNQNIKQYFENFMEARAVVREARVAIFPDALDAAPSFTRSRTSANLNTEPVNATGTGAVATTSQLQSTHLFSCHSKHPGRPTCGAKSATRCGRRNTPLRSARRIWRTSGSPSRRPGRIFFRNSRPGCTAKDLQRDRGSGSESTRSDPCTL